MVCLKGSKIKDSELNRSEIIFALLPSPTPQVRQSFARCISILAESQIQQIKHISFSLMSV